jgi:hypothetical protein
MRRRPCSTAYRPENSTYKPAMRLRQVEKYKRYAGTIAGEKVRILAKGAYKPLRHRPWPLALARMEQGHIETVAGTAELKVSPSYRSLT